MTILQANLLPPIAVVPDKLLLPLWAEIIKVIPEAEGVITLR